MTVVTDLPLEVLQPSCTYSFAWDSLFLNEIAHSWY